MKKKSQEFLTLKADSQYWKRKKNNFDLVFSIFISLPTLIQLIK